jgi:hypothetical protein
MLIGRHSEDELLEISPAILGIAIGDGYITGVEVDVILTTDAEGGCVDTEAVRAVTAGKQAVSDDLIEEFSWAVGGDRIECPAQVVVVEMLGGNAAFWEQHGRRPR